jgi:hypothetical protein
MGMGERGFWIRPWRSWCERSVGYGVVPTGRCTARWSRWIPSATGRSGPHSNASGGHPPPPLPPPPPQAPTPPVGEAAGCSSYARSTTDYARLSSDTASFRAIERD